MNCWGLRANSDVLTDVRETRSGPTGSFIEGRFAGKSVREASLVRHQQRVPARRFR
jgi:hypothetical protein